MREELIIVIGYDAEKEGGRQILVENFVFLTETPKYIQIF